MFLWIHVHVHPLYTNVNEIHQTEKRVFSWLRQAVLKSSYHAHKNDTRGAFVSKSPIMVHWKVGTLTLNIKPQQWNLRQPDKCCVTILYKVSRQLLMVSFFHGLSPAAPMSKIYYFNVYYIIFTVHTYNCRTLKTKFNRYVQFMSHYTCADYNATSNVT